VTPRRPQVFSVPPSTRESQETAAVQRLGAGLHIQVIAKLPQVTSELQIKQFSQRIIVPKLMASGVVVQTLRNMKRRTKYQCADLFDKSI
jgi:hypothetical protein